MTRTPAHLGFSPALVRACGAHTTPAVPQTLCVAGRGSQYIEHGGYTWRTLDGADPQGGWAGAPNGGCQRIGYDYNGGGDNIIYGEPNYLALPAGWVLAPNDATSIAVVAAYGWSTHKAVLADGTAWLSGNYAGRTNVPPGTSPSVPGGSGGSDTLATSGGTYTVRFGGMRVLARCG
eukprot:COSAG04_NODE_1284_length_7376_cov_4.157345_2_plen_177_part_00